MLGHHFSCAIDFTGQNTDLYTVINVIYVASSSVLFLIFIFATEKQLKGVKAFPGLNLLVC